MASNEREVPEYLEVDHDKRSAKYIRVPAFDEVPYPVMMEPNLVVEYYSR
jgi:small subunit ribosomal protein S4